MLNLDFTGERLVPGRTVEFNFRESQMRYAFAGGFAKGCVVLDIASGAGIGTHYLLKAGAANCFGLDVSFDAVRYANSRYQGCRFVVCDATSLCFADRSADLIVSFETVEHLRDPRTFFAQCKRVLRPDGLLLCSTPNREISRWGPGNAFHVSEMTAEELLDLMQEFFVDCRVYGQGDASYPYVVVRSMAVEVLERLHVREFVSRSVRQFLRPPLSEICTLTEFPQQNGHYPKQSVRPYISNWHNKPQFVLVLGRKHAQEQ